MYGYLVIGKQAGKFIYKCMGATAHTAYVKKLGDDGGVEFEVPKNEIVFSSFDLNACAAYCAKG